MADLALRPSNEPTSPLHPLQSNCLGSKSVAAGRDEPSPHLVDLYFSVPCQMN
jgi:hypothetical protein